MVAKQLSGVLGYGIGEPLRSKTKVISSTKWRRLLGLVRAAGFWTVQPTDQSVGLGAARSVLEGTRDGDYRAWNVWSPTDPPFGHYEKLCRFMIKLSGLESS